MEKKESRYITAEELNTIQSMNTDFTKMKMALGEIEIERHALLNTLDKMKEMFAHNEQMLIEKYGKHSVINIKTGEVTDNVQDNTLVN